MMYIHYCARCERIHMLNGHKQLCPKCREALTELKMDYMTYARLDMDERQDFKNRCSDPLELSKLKTTYRMFKYSKWYKQLHKSSKQPDPAAAL